MANEKAKENLKKKEEKAQEGLQGFVKRIVAVFATFFVVIGVAVIGLLARDTMPKIVEEIAGEATSTGRYEPAFLMVDDSSASLYKMDGSFIKQMKWPDDTGILDKPVSQLMGVDIMSGESRWLKNEFAISTSTKFRSPDGRREARIEAKRRDGSTPLIISYGNDDDVRVLRTGGTLIKEVELLGWMDDKTFIFTGSATGTKAIFYLDLGGVVGYIGSALENTWDYKIFAKEIYCLSSNLAENGDEEDSKIAPGSLYSVGLKGEVKELVKNEDSVIQAYALSADRIVYSLVDQSMYQKTGSSETLIGHCMPLMILPTGEILCRAGDSVEIRSEGAEPKRLFEAKDAVLFYLDRVRFD